MQKFIDYLTLIRVPNDIMIGIGVIVGELLAIRTIPPPINMLEGFLVGFLISASVMILNDIADIEIDRINNPNKPLVKGEIKIKSAYILSIICAVTGVIVSIFINIYNLLIAIIFWLIGIAYNFYFKRTGLVGNMLVSLSVAIPFIYGSLAMNIIDINVLVLASAAFLSNTFREIIKGILDIEGDKKLGLATLPIKYGVEKSYLFSSIFLIIALIIGFIPVMIHTITNLESFISLMIIADILFIFSLMYPLNKSYEKRSILISKRVCLLGMLFGMLSFIFGVY